MRAIIIDDEKHCVRTLKWTLKQYCGEVEVVAVANNGTEGVTLIEQHKPDIIFLDVEMPLMTGIDMLLQFQKIDFKVIFTTAYDQYAINAIKLHALDYLLKPIDKDELIEAVQKAKSGDVKPSLKKIQEIQQSQKAERLHRIGLPTLNGLVFVNTNDIVCIIGEGNYSHFKIKEQPKILLSKKLKEVEEMLKDYSNFYRIHKSFIINLSYVSGYVRGEGGTVVMTDGTEIAVSRNKKDEFLELFNRP